MSSRISLEMNNSRAIWLKIEMLESCLMFCRLFMSRIVPDVEDLSDCSAMLVKWKNANYYAN